jgi:phosphate acetyltransferase
MKPNIYLTTTQAQSGKGILILGLMEWLTRRSHHVAVFRPIIADRPEDDRFLRLAIERYNISEPVECLFGCTLQQARELMNAGREKHLQEIIIDRFKTLEKQCDSVLCIGTDFRFATSGLELDFNIQVARNLGTPMVLMTSADSRSPGENVDMIVSLVRSVRQRKGTVLAAVINRVEPNSLDELKRLLAQVSDNHSAYLALPDESSLEHPTVGDLLQVQGVQFLSGCKEDLNRDIRAIKVAAMEIPHYLEHISEGDLIITPGDRADIILGTIAAYQSSHYPQASAILLSGGLKPAESVLKLLDGLQEPPLPVLHIDSDTFDTAITVNQIQPELHADNPRKIAAALGLIEAHADLETFLAPLVLQPLNIVTPLMFEYGLIQRAKSSCQHIVLPEGNDDRILRAAEILLLREVVELTLLGEPERIRERAATLGLNIDAANIIDPLQSDLTSQFATHYFQLRQHKGISEQMALDLMQDWSYFGTMMVLEGYADGMVSGAVHSTQHTIRPAFEVIRTRPGAALISSVFFMCLPDRVLVYGDCAINPDPDAEQLADIAIASADTAAAFGVSPRVAMLSYSTGSSGKGQDVDKVRQAVKLARARRPELELEGPIQYDAAVDPGVAATKLPESKVAGNASVLIFPDLNTGNNTYKAVQRSSGAVAVGPVLQGLNKPVNDLSRGCTVTDIVNTVAITAIQAQNQEK